MLYLLIIRCIGIVYVYNKVTLFGVKMKGFM